MGFARPDVEMSMFCRAVFSGCSSGHSSGERVTITKSSELLKTKEGDSKGFFSNET